MVGFIISSSYALYNTYIFSKSIYRDEDIVLIIEGNLSGNLELIDRLESLKLFQKVIIFKEDADFQLNSYICEKLDVLHIFSPCKYTQKVLERTKCKVIVSEEGMGTYLLEESNWFFKKYRIDEIWLNNIELYIGVQFKDKLKEVKTTELIKKQNFEKCLEELNYIFGYVNDELERVDCIYLDQYFTYDEDVSFEEQKFWNSLEVYFDYYEVFVKKHTSIEHSKKFRDYKYMLSIDSIIPMELMILNIINKGKKKFVLITISSSSAFNLKFLFEDYIDIEIIFLYRLFINNVFDKYIEKFNKDNSIKISKIDNLDELDYLLSKEKHIKKLNPNKDRDFVFSKKEKSDINIILKKYNLNLLYLNYYMGLIIFLKDIYIKMARSKNVYIWGIGNPGKGISEILGLYNIEHELIDTYEEGTFNGKRINKYRNINLENDSFVIIATYAGREEVEKELIGNGKIEREDYINLF